ncbi:MAG: hypothetical protein R2723_03905 [Microbacterium sp.]
MPTVLRTRVGAARNQAPSGDEHGAVAAERDEGGAHAGGHEVLLATTDRSGQRHAVVEGDGGEARRRAFVAGLDEIGAPCCSTTARRAAPEVSTAIRRAFGAARTAAMTLDVEVVGQPRAAIPPARAKAPPPRRRPRHVDERRVPVGSGTADARQVDLGGG